MTFYVIPTDGGATRKFVSIRDVASYLNGRCVPDYLVGAEGLPMVKLGQTHFAGMLQELKLWQTGLVPA